MEHRFIKASIKDGVGLIELDRPRELNALNRAMVEEIGAVCQDFALDPVVRVLVITGEQHFAAGADIGNMVNLTPEQADSFSFRHVMAGIENLPKPVIAAIKGYALGGGLELALACDLRIASPSASFGLPEIKLGIFPGAGGTIRLPRLIGPSRAKMMIYTGKIINAEKALNWGLIDGVEENPLTVALQLADEIKARAPIALKLAKKCVNMAFDVDASSGIEQEALAWQCTFATVDQKEGMQAFIEKRPPVFRGE